ncbi:Lectin-B [Paramyrothecium foliicola]|nr:Lectin-B [Paramyrothecium foliicola]
MANGCGHGRRNLWWHDWLCVLSNVGCMLFQGWPLRTIKGLLWRRMVRLTLDPVSVLPLTKIFNHSQPLAGNCDAPPVVAPPPPGPGSPSPDGTCGGTNQFTCAGSTFGKCCSSTNWCGDESGHCGAGCQTKFGNCTVTAENVSTDGRCGFNGKTCLGSVYGPCCSSGGWCGDQDGHCKAGCQSGFGTCGATETESAAPGPSTPPTDSNISTDGACGKNGKTCLGSVFGDCCSTNNFCGRETAHCAAATCQSAFGKCNAETDISSDGACGKNGKTCKGSAYGDCCSEHGFCGKDSGFCGAGCQATFGTCDSSSSNVSTDGKCGSNGKTCKGSTYGNCCSAQGFCGDKDHCEAGCQAAFGTCNSGAGNISTDGRCGSNGKTCKGSTFGDCCSAQGYCGGSSSFCGAGCQLEYGTCDASATNISTDGRCGNNGKTCKGSSFGDCCSAQGYCGSTSGFCSAGCQIQYGTCDASASNISTDGKCGANGKTCKGSTYGACCSAQGFCGDKDHCDAGCQANFGSCNSGAGNISTDGACGKNGKTCKGSSFGQCCSAHGFCGGSTDFCGAGCQASFGTCSSGSGTISTDGSCGKNGKTCKGSGFGDCCSSSNSCGGSSDHCGAGCQTSFGTCNAGSGSISTDGACGKNGKTCRGSTFGTCCSSNGFCGATSDFCGAGCQSSFGVCNGGSNAVSTDGFCGKNGKICKGSTYGDCCSQQGYCGKETAHCGAGCQLAYGTCSSGSQSISTDGACGKNGKTCKGSAFGDCCSEHGYCGKTSGFCGTGW